MRKSIDNAIIAAFAADALSLGVHWVYDTEAIAARYGRIENFVTPELAPYHQGKKAGQLTHYGDQMLLLLEHVSDVGAFQADSFSRSWQEMMRTYSGYLDQASKTTLTRLDRGLLPREAASSSDDLSGAARLAPLLAVYAHQPEQLAQAAMNQARLTHSSLVILATAELLARSCTVVLQGVEPIDALTHAARNVSDITVADMVRRGIAAKDENSVTAIKNFGQSCSVLGALPSAVQLVARHGCDLRTALVENVMAGGDSAARGMFVATLIAAQPNVEIPQEWLERLRCLNEVKKLLQAIP